MDDPMAGFPVTVDLPVQWGDQDAFQHVNNTVYLRWFESGRIAYARRVGLHELMAAERVGPILASIHCDYRRPITFPDSVRVGTRVARIGRTSLTMDHRIAAGSTGAIAAEGTSVIVLYDYTAAAPTPIPDRFRESIGRLERGEIGS